MHYFSVNKRVLCPKEKQAVPLSHNYNRLLDLKSHVHGSARDYHGYFCSIPQFWHSVHIELEQITAMIVNPTLHFTGIAHESAVMLCLF